MLTSAILDGIPTPRFAGHETFTLRYGWLKKGIDGTSSDPLVFTRDDALVTLGVGKNMVRSIRHWGLATGILEEDSSQPNNRGRHLQPSRLGRMIFAARGLDPYLEEPGTLWLLHWLLASCPDGPTTWYWAFNHFAGPELTKEKLLATLQDLSEQAGWKRVAVNSLRRDIDCFIRTYVPSRTGKTMVLEDTLDCPLAELGLIREIEIGRVYAFARGEHPSLPGAVFVYALLSFWASTAQDREALTFDEIAYKPGSPGRVFKLSENALVDYLETVEQVTGQAVTYDATAGLRQVYRRQDIEPLDVLRGLKPTRGKGSK